MAARRTLRAVGRCAAFLFLTLTNAGVAGASTETVIERFDPRTAFPSSGLTVDPSGHLFGEARGGSGLVFELTPPQSPGGAWNRTTVLRFFGGAQGCSPDGGLLRDSAGTLYGVGGCGYYDGGGIVFRLSPPVRPGQPWTERVLYRFGSDLSGGPYAPHGRLVADDKGNLYGTTYLGGLSNAGTVFRLTPGSRPNAPWQETILYAFTGAADGALPDHGVIVGRDGALYGTTNYGGFFSTFCSGGCGVVFRLTPPSGAGPWTETVLHAFTGGDGALPECDLTVDASGNIYGTTEVGYTPGAGTVFELERPARPGGSWAEDVLDRFTESSDIAYPSAGVIFDGAGNLYGTTQVGGLQQNIHDRGGAFKLAPPTTKGGAWTQTTLHYFAGGSDGLYPLTPLVFGADGSLYGTTSSGGGGGCTRPPHGCGTVFRLTP